MLIFLNSIFLCNFQKLLRKILCWSSIWQSALIKGIVNLKICSERKMPFGKEKEVNVPKNHHGRCLADAYFYGRSRNFGSFEPIYHRMIIFFIEENDDWYWNLNLKVEESIHTLEVKNKTSRAYVNSSTFFVHHYGAPVSWWTIHEIIA